MMRKRYWITGAMFICAALPVTVSGQPAAPSAERRFVPPPPTPNDTLLSPEISPDGRASFRIYAPDARKVTVTGEMLEFGTPPLEMTRANDGVWSVTSAVIEPGAYRYTISVDGVSVVDPKNLATSKSARQVQSLLVVSRDDFAADRTVPHGAISTVHYASPKLDLQRRMHVYTPPGYGETGRKYPVLYLLHGGGDSDDSWPTVGRAGYILDNLIASKRAVPMIVVMPMGGVDGKSQPMTWEAAKDPFTDDLMSGIMPYIERNYRVSNRPEDTALAGLSMGGLQTLNIGLTRTDRFRWLGVFSSGWFPADLDAFEKNYGARLGERTAKLSLLYYTNGAQDIALPQAKQVYAMFERSNVKYESHETPGGHTWINWRDNLREFASLIFSK